MDEKRRLTITAIEAIPFGHTRTALMELIEYVEHLAAMVSGDPDTFMRELETDDEETTGEEDSHDMPGD